MRVVGPLRGHGDVEQLPVEVGGGGHRVRAGLASVEAVETLVRGGGGSVDDVAVHVSDLVVTRVVHLLEGRHCLGRTVWLGCVIPNPT